VLDDRVSPPTRGRSRVPARRRRTGATVNVVDATLAGTLDIVAVVAVAAIDDMSPESMCAASSCTVLRDGPHHHPHGTRRIELATKSAIESIQERASPRPS